MGSDVPQRLREQVARRAEGRCEYCGLHEDDAGLAHQVDHVIGRKHGGLSDGGNLAYSCIVCNRHKGSDLASVHPGTGATVRLFDPRRQRWAEHFRWSWPSIEALTDTGMITLRLLRVNEAERLAERVRLGRSRFGLPEV